METGNLDNRLRLSYYKEIGVLDPEHNVFLMRNSLTGLPFVKKIVPAELRPVYQQLYLNRIPGIPLIEDILEDGEQTVVIEEYISGKTLDAVLKESGPLPETEVKRIAAAICSTLECLHSLNPPVIHRDIKPANVILTGNGSIYLIDFDAAKHQDLKENRDTRLLGTAGYAAPEQYGFGPSRVQTDLYGLGILMAELLTGVPDAAAYKNNRLGKVIRKATHMDVSRRFASASAMKKALYTQSSVTVWIVLGILVHFALIIAVYYSLLIYLPKEIHKSSTQTPEEISEQPHSAENVPETSTEDRLEEDTSPAEQTAGEYWVEVGPADEFGMVDVLDPEHSAFVEIEQSRILEDLEKDAESMSAMEEARENGELSTEDLVGEGLVFSNEDDFERELNQGKNLEGCIVTFKVKEFHPNSTFGYNLWAGTHLNFVSNRHPGAGPGDILTVKTTYIASRVGSWIIQYELLDLIPASSSESSTEVAPDNE